MIYLNRRYSSEIDALESAGRYFLRSVDLKPADYFAYERLGWVGLRRALQTGDGKAREEVLKEAEERASRAIQLAPQSRSAQLIRLYLRIARLGTTGIAAKKEDVASLIADIDSQDPEGKDFSRRWMRLACGWFGLSAAADSAAWYGGKTILLQEADKFVDDSKADSIWRVVQMRESIARFRKEGL